jgi:hypothetical protein
MVVSAEDCHDLVTGEIVALFDAWTKINETSRDKSKGRIFFAKAVVILATCRHSRDADELNILVVDRLPEDEFDAALAESESIMRVGAADFLIPSYVYDVHTRRGKARGKTKAMFLREERDALTNQLSMFSNLDAMIDSPEYVEPQFDR